MKVLLCMIFLHLLDDYKIQGILANLKCRQWWIDNNLTQKKYKYDYIIALLEHGFMNAFFIHIPIYIWYTQNIILITIGIFISTLFHAIIDDYKANDRIINLIQDQLCHIGFIILLWANYAIMKDIW